MARGQGKCASFAGSGALSSLGASHDAPRHVGESRMILRQFRFSNETGAKKFCRRKRVFEHGRVVEKIKICFCFVFVFFLFCFVFFFYLIINSYYYYQYHFCLFFSFCFICTGRNTLNTKKRASGRFLRSTGQRSQLSAADIAYRLYKHIYKYIRCIYLF